jgi:hypothetical protein
MQSKQLQNSTIPNPGNLGINTQDSPVTLPEGFATIAENCVIDKKGRITSRKGREYVTTTGGTSSVIEQIFEAEWADGTTTVFSVGANKVYTGTTTLTDVTGAAVITDNDWQIAQLQDVVYFFQSGHAPLQYDKAVGALDEVTAHSGYVATVQQGTCCLSGFGRLWTAKDDTVYWSDLLDGVDWGSGTSGSIDLSTVFPADVDTVVGLAAHNNFLIIFLTRNILVYNGADSPATMALQDTIRNIGCVSRDTIVNTGSDILFLDRSGFRSLGRTIQEKSAPLGRVSRNVNNDLLAIFDAETSTVRSYYTRKERFIITFFPDSQLAYVMDTQFPLEDGSFRITTWTGITNYCAYELIDGTLYLGGTDGIMEYSADYTDEGAAYTMRLYTPHTSLQTPHILKIGKELDITTEGGNGYVVSVLWAYDWGTNYKSRTYTITSADAADFGAGTTGGEFGVSEFGAAAGIYLDHVKMAGSGRNVSFAIEADINGSDLALQEINVHTLIGRIQ